MSNSVSKLLIVSIAVFLFLHSPSPGQKELKLYPGEYNTRPDIPSPFTTSEGREIITLKKGDMYHLLDVTQENGEIYSCMHSFWGKGQQLWIDAPDFPTLGKTGLHSEVELDKKKYITGRKIELINYLARPGRFSHSGFIASHEDIISVLRGDNLTVKKMGFRHCDLAKPLFHIWNIIQGNYIRGRWAKDISVFYNGNEVILNAEGGKGYQESIFHDEIEGRWNISIRREFNPDEIKKLHARFGHLGEGQGKNIQKKLGRIDISEMNPFYIQRYGFYEGATAFRADPVAIALIFGIRTLKETLALFGEDLYQVVFSDMFSHTQ